MKGDCSSILALNSSAVMVKPSPLATTGPDFLALLPPLQAATASAAMPMTARRRSMDVLAPWGRSRSLEGRNARAPRLLPEGPRVRAGTAEKSTERRGDQGLDGPRDDPGAPAPRVMVRPCPTPRPGPPWRGPGAPRGRPAAARAPPPPPGRAWVWPA